MRYRALIATLLAFCLSVLTACSGDVSASTGSLTYDQIKGTGLAGNCPTLEETSRGYIPIDKSQSYVLTDLCLQPTSYFVKEEPTSKRQAAEFVPGKLLTRYTYSLAQIQGSLKPESDGSLTFVEKDGIDFQPITVQLPGGEQVPFLFTIKGLVAKSQAGLDSISTATDFQGEFKVPSYRLAGFLDPKGRGTATGYDTAVALPAKGDSKEFTEANVKRTPVLNGKISLQVSKVNSATGEVAGIFVSEQPSDTDLGDQAPVDVKIRGIFYGRIDSVS
jgi:photosystem II oxygen-evolving enhancer protein 1